MLVETRYSRHVYAVREKGPRAKNVALCGLRLDGFHPLLVQGLIACSVGSGSEKSVFDAEASTRALRGAHEECGMPGLVADEPKGDGQELVRLVAWS